MVTFIEKAQIEEVVGTKIKNLGLYQKAFTHKSALKEYENLTESFETLEFIGDSVLGFVITKYLFDRYENKQEGFLTKARTKLVRGETLAHIANHLGLNKYVIMDEKGMRNSWNNNTKILEDVFEALIGAIYMDIGLIHAKEFILRIYQDPAIINMNMIMIDDNGNYPNIGYLVMRREFSILTSTSKTYSLPGESREVRNRLNKMRPGVILNFWEPTPTMISPKLA